MPTEEAAPNYYIGHTFKCMSVAFSSAAVDWEIRVLPIDGITVHLRVRPRRSARVCAVNFKPQWLDGGHAHEAIETAVVRLKREVMDK